MAHEASVNGSLVARDPEWHLGNPSPRRGNVRAEFPEEPELPRIAYRLSTGKRLHPNVQSQDTADEDRTPQLEASASASLDARHSRIRASDL